MEEKRQGCFMPIGTRDGSLMRCGDSPEVGSLWCERHGREVLEEQVRRGMHDKKILEDSEEN